MAKKASRASRIIVRSELVNALQLKQHFIHKDKTRSLRTVFKHTQFAQLTLVNRKHISQHPDLFSSDVVHSTSEQWKLLDKGK